jgi:ApaG protein
MGRPVDRYWAGAAARQARSLPPRMTRCNEREGGLPLALRRAPGQSGTVSCAVTQGIRVSVEALYLPQHSDPAENRYVFAYTVVISNDGVESARLKTRHWFITDASGQIEEVQGPGVVGETPYLAPGQAFQYTSGCVLRTPRGTMHGTYKMLRDGGDEFEAEIAPFVLAAPTPESDMYLN